MAGIKRALQRATESATEEVTALASRGGMYARGMASEGFAGGYLAALYDVALALNGVEPAKWRHWEERRKEMEN